MVPPGCKRRRTAQSLDGHGHRAAGRCVAELPQRVVAPAVDMSVREKGARGRAADPNREGRETRGRIARGFGWSEHVGGSLALIFGSRHVTGLGLNLVGGHVTGLARVGGRIGQRVRSIDDRGGCAGRSVSRRTGIGLRASALRHSATAADHESGRRR
jgi:hypothetical protein